MHFEVNQVSPVRHPLVQERGIFCFHELVTTVQRIVHPACSISQRVGLRPLVLRGGDPAPRRSANITLAFFANHLRE